MGRTEEVKNYVINCFYMKNSGQRLRRDKSNLVVS